MDGGPGTELVVDAAGEDELLAEATKLRRLNIEKLELPIDNG